MKHITSRENALFKELKQLASSSQARRKAALTILDGVHLCQAYLEHSAQPVWCVVSETSQQNPEVAALLASAENAVVLSDGLYEQLSQVEHGVGIFFVASIPTLSPPNQLNETAVVLDNLQDPGNVGSLLRSAAAAGIKHVFCSAGTVSAWSPKVLRAGMGAHFLLRIYENTDLLSFLNPLVATGSIPVLATSSYAVQTVYQVNLNRPVIWMFGHEGQGLSDQLMDCATEQITIPHQGKIESLNVAACAAICFFEQVRQRLDD